MKRSSLVEWNADAPELARALDEHDAVIVGGGIRYGHHARYLEAAVRDHLGAIAAQLESARVA